VIDLRRVISEEACRQWRQSGEKDGKAPLNSVTPLMGFRGLFFFRGVGVRSWSREMTTTTECLKKFNFLRNLKSSHNLFLFPMSFPRLF
jgi:hypothetical protein